MIRGVLLTSIGLSYYPFDIIFWTWTQNNVGHHETSGPVGLGSFRGIDFGLRYMIMFVYLSRHVALYINVALCNRYYFVS